VVQAPSSVAAFAVNPAKKFPPTTDRQAWNAIVSKALRDVDAKLCFRPNRQLGSCPRVAGQQARGNRPGFAWNMPGAMIANNGGGGTLARLGINTRGQGPATFSNVNNLSRFANYQRRTNGSDPPGVPSECGSGSGCGSPCVATLAPSLLAIISPCSFVTNALSCTAPSGSTIAILFVLPFSNTNLATSTPLPVTIYLRRTDVVPVGTTTTPTQTPFTLYSTAGGGDTLEHTYLFYTCHTSSESYHLCGSDDRSRADARRPSPCRPRNWTHRDGDRRDQDWLGKQPPVLDDWPVLYGRCGWNSRLYYQCRQLLYSARKQCNDT
jgi:hypothetical protein